MSKNTIIYVKLLNENVDVWRPVEAEHIGERVYKILPQIYERDTEQWEFEPEQLVECKLLDLDKCKALAAVREK